MKKICIIGLGNMGNAMLKILKTNPEFEVFGFDKDSDVKELIEKSDIIIFAIKPQDFEEAAENLDIHDKLIISIMAGISVEKIKEKLNCKKVARVMPNLPLKVGKSLSGWFCDSAIEQNEKEIIKNVLQSFGEEIEVDQEDKMNSITALSGSGPAYFFYLCELIKKSAEKYGFSKEEAEKIALNTFFGSASLLENEKVSAEEMRGKITSKGGTTNAAISHLEENGFEQIFAEAIEKAFFRAKELNN